MINGAQYVRRELMIRLVRSFDAGTLETDIDRIPIVMRPKEGAASRCCIYHDRAVLKYRLMCLLGFACEEETDEARPLSSYLAEAMSRPRLAIAEAGAEPLSVCSAGCSGCPSSRVMVTGNCRGCFARPCMYNCPKKAISVVNQVSTIDQDLCIKCGKCINVCPFHAIMKTSVPCEEACPTGAIRKDENGRAKIDFSRCCYCGKCFAACPFSAVMERSELIDVLCAMKRGEKLAAMVAPSAQSQFPGTLEQLFTAVSKLGFEQVVEVALGAEMTTAHEAREFQERMGAGEKLMTTSCCPAYVEFVRKIVPDFAKCVSETPSPMVYTAQIVHEKFPGMKTVFVGPCIAKRHEAVAKGVDYVLSFEELGALLAGRKIDVMTCEPWALPRPAIATARNFARSCGVTEAVLHETANLPADFKLDGKFINGLDKKSAAQLKLYGAGKLPANFLEVMACCGGCVKGPTSLS